MSDAHRDEIAKLEALYADNPQGRVFTHLAEAYRKAGDLDRAHDVLTEGLQNHPDYSSAHVVLGRVLQSMGRTDEAADEFRRVLELDSHNLIALRALGDLARDRGDDREALAYYSDLVELEPSEELREEITRLSGDGAPAEPGVEPEFEPRTEPERESVVEAQDEGVVAAPVSEPEAEPVPEQEAEPAEEPETVPVFESTRESYAEPEEDEEPVFTGYGADPSGVTTETIAQVYARQGLYDRAADVYRELLRSRPDDTGLQERLQEIEQLAAAQAQGEEEPGETPALEETDVAADPAAAMEPMGDLDQEEESWSEESWSGESWSDESADEDETAGIAGFESGEVDLESDVEPLEGLESQELDPETGLAMSGPRDEAEPGDMDEALDGADVPAPPEEARWSEPDETSDGDSTGWSGMDLDEPEVAEASVGDEDAWVTGEAGPVDDALSAGAPDTPGTQASESGAIRDYLGGLLGWEGGEAATADAPPSPEAVPDQESEGASEEREDERSESGAEAGLVSETPEPAGEERGPEEPRAGGPAPDSSAGDDDDLEMFRSWLESLKQ